MPPFQTFQANDVYTTATYDPLEDPLNRFPHWTHAGVNRIPISATEINTTTTNTADLNVYSDGWSYTLTDSFKRQIMEILRSETGYAVIKEMVAKALEELTQINVTEEEAQQALERIIQE